MILGAYCRIHPERGMGEMADDGLVGVVAGIETEKRVSSGLLGRFSVYIKTCMMPAF